MPERFLSSDEIPRSYGCEGSHLLCLPPALARIYTDEIDRRGLREQARRPRAEDGPYRWGDAELTLDHFAERFTGRAVDENSVALDPKDDLQNASDLIIRAFAGGKIAVLDAPCGAGAASLTLLATIACLRKEHRLPTVPLDVTLVGGDLSEPARELAQSLLESLRPSLEKQSVFVDAGWAEWDAFDAEQTTSLLNNFITRGVQCTTRLLVLANFSSFLHREKKFEKANPQIQEMIRWTSDRPSSLVL